MTHTKLWVCLGIWTELTISEHTTGHPNYYQKLYLYSEDAAPLADSALLSCCTYTLPTQHCRTHSIIVGMSKILEWLVKNIKFGSFSKSRVNCSLYYRNHPPFIVETQMSPVPLPIMHYALLTGFISKHGWSIYLLYKSLFIQNICRMDKLRILHGR